MRREIAACREVGAKALRVSCWEREMERSGTSETRIRRARVEKGGKEGGGERGEKWLDMQMHESERVTTVCVERAGESVSWCAASGETVGGEVGCVLHR